VESAEADTMEVSMNRKTAKIAAATSPPVANEVTLKARKVR